MDDVPKHTWIDWHCSPSDPQPPRLQFPDGSRSLASGYVPLHVTTFPAKLLWLVIGSLARPPNFEACPTHTEFTEFGPQTNSLILNAQCQPPRDDPQVRPRSLDTPFAYKDTRQLVARICRQRPYRFIFLFEPETDHLNRRNVVQEAHRQGPALRHCGRCRSRVHHPHAQEGTCPCRTNDSPGADPDNG